MKTSSLGFILLLTIIWAFPVEAANTLIADIYSSNHRIYEVDGSGTTVWTCPITLNGPFDAERLGNGNTLIAQTWNNSVIEVDSSGTIVWSYNTGLGGPYDAERLGNGNTLIADSGNSRIIEVNPSGAIVWSYTNQTTWPIDAERLGNGNTLIADGWGTVFEIDNTGTIHWHHLVGNSGVWDAERLGNGNTLIAEDLNGRVIEVNAAGTIVWSYNITTPIDAERLGNGNTLIANYAYNQVIEVDSSGTTVWSYSTGINNVWDAERIPEQPGPGSSIPTIPVIALPIGLLTISTITMWRRRRSSIMIS